MTSQHALAPARQYLNKVAEVTIYFWAIKVLCTTVGESAADFLNVNLNFGLTGTSIVTGLLLAVALFFQVSATRYTPATYWITVALVSVFGTLVTDNLTDDVGLPLEASTLIFSVLLALTFGAWYRNEKTLSIHSIVTRQREAFYWLAILFTFALGTATGDLMAEALGLGYAPTGLIVAVVIAIASLAWRLGLNPVLSFWFVYILTCPLGASIGDLLSQPWSQGGLGLGATVTSLIFTAAIVATVCYLAMTKADVICSDEAGRVDESADRGGLWQTVVVMAVVVVAGATGYVLRTSALQEEASAPTSDVRPTGGGSLAAAASPLVDLSLFRGICQDTLDRLDQGDQGDQAGATARVDDVEIEWDNAEARLKPKNPAAWTDIDGKIDTVLRELRSPRPDATGEKAGLTTLLDTLR